MTPLMIAVVLAAAVAALMFVVGTVTAERAEVRDSLRRLEGYQIQDVRDQEMLAPISERVIAPVLEGLSGLTGRFTPQGYRENVAQKLVLAGNSTLNVDQVLVFKLLGLISGIVWLPLILVLLGFGGLFGIMVALFGWFASFMFPDVYLSRGIEKRQHEIAVQLPDVLDLLVISVEAGLGLSAAIQRVADELTVSHPELGSELTLVNAEMRAGVDRSVALKNLADRTGLEDIRGLVALLVQTMRFGTSVADALRVYSEEFRDKRMQAAEEQAAKIGTKMIFPLVTCLFPSFFLVAIGPAVLRLMDVFSHMSFATQ